MRTCLNITTYQFLRVSEVLRCLEFRTNQTNLAFTQTAPFPVCGNSFAHPDQFFGHVGGQCRQCRH